nr:NB-ARC domain-containing protein [Ktedonospora formicarum]
MRQWSQQEVADRLGTTRPNVSRWEAGITTPGPYFRTKLCELFCKNAHELGLFSEPKDHAQDLPIAPPSDIPCWVIPYSSNPYFTGREECLVQLIQDLCINPESIQVITGLPGVGKTSLAIALAHHPLIQKQFCDGVIWVDLGPTPSLMETMSEWATLLGITPSEAQTVTSPETVARWVHQRMHTRQMLFILDDTWNVSDVVALQVGGNRCRYVVTTRSPLLAYTIAPSSVTSLLPLSDAASHDLLSHLAPQVSQCYPQELEALVRSCGGLPLALTLLGRFMHTQSLYSSSRRLLRTLQQLHQDLQARFQVAIPKAVGDSQPGSLLGTERSLRLAIDVSVQQLPLPAQRALFALSVMAPTSHSFSEEAALAICNVPAETFDVLVDSGLVEVCQEDRYRVHQTILDYTQLQEPDSAVEERFTIFFVTFVETYAQDFHVLNQDLPLIIYALERACVQHRYSLLLRGILALQPFVEQRRLYSLAQTLVQWGQQAAMALQDREGLVRIWLFSGNVATLRGEVQHAQHAYFEGLELARELQHQQLLGELLVLVGGALGETDISGQAERYLLEGLQALKGFDDKASLSLVFQYLGELADTLGKSTEALSFYTRGLAIARQTQNKKMISALLQNLGSQAVRYGHYAQAVVHYEEGLACARELGDQQRESALLMNLGMLAWYEERQDEAIRFSYESLQLAREIGHQMRISSVLQNLGMMLRHQNRLTQAEQYLQESLEIARQIGHQWLIGETLGEVGFLALKQRQTTKAKEIFTEMHQRAQVIGAPMLLGLALFGFAQIAEQDGQLCEVQSLVQESKANLIQVDHHLTQEVDAWYSVLVDNHRVEKE